MTSELRPAVEVVVDVLNAAERAQFTQRTKLQNAVGYVEADREAVRAEVVRDIVAWLRRDEDPYPDSYDIADEIEHKFGERAD